MPPEYLALAKWCLTDFYILVEEINDKQIWKWMKKDEDKEC
jgi:hypothetical protein